MIFFFKNFFILLVIFISDQINNVFKSIYTFINKKKINKKLLEKICKRKNYLNYTIKNKKLILVESLIVHPAYFIKNIIIANHLRKITGQEIIILLNRNDNFAINLAKSFKIKKIIFFENLSFFSKLKSFFETFFIFKNQINFKKFLKLKYKKMQLGKLVYDNTLRIEKVGTYKIIDYKIIKTTFKFLNSIKFYEKIFNDYKITYLVQDEIQFYPASTLFQLALSKNIECFIKEGQRRFISLKKVNSLSQCFENKSKFSRNLIKKLYSSKSSKKIINAGKKAMINRINGSAKENDINDARHFKKGMLISKKNICKKFNWDYNKPIGIILANDLTDGVFTNSWSLFKDNVSWLNYHLEHIKNNRKVNWLVKKHPSDTKNSINKGTAYYFNKYVRDIDHIKLLPDKVNAKSLHNIVDFVFCSHGSAGLEFPFSKIPCVTTSDSLYEGLGFTFECKNLNDLKKTIFKPEKLKVISNKSYDLLCVFLDLYINRTKIKIGIPDYNPSFENTNRFINKILLFLKKNNFYENTFHNALSDQIKHNSKHTAILSDIQF